VWLLPTWPRNPASSSPAPGVNFAAAHSPTTFFEFRSPAISASAFVPATAAAALLLSLPRTRFLLTRLHLNRRHDSLPRICRRPFSCSFLRFGKDFELVQLCRPRFLPRGISSWFSKHPVVVNRLRLERADRLLWAWLLRFWSGWRSALAIVKQETVIAWHRRGVSTGGWSVGLPFVNESRSSPYSLIARGQ
jgi:hypothetical protein